MGNSGEGNLIDIAPRYECVEATDRRALLGKRNNLHSDYRIFSVVKGRNELLKDEAVKT